MHGDGVPYRTYWGIWAVLLVLTLVMLLMETVRLSRGATVLVLVAAMLLKAGLITGWFMHLRFERRTLLWPVVGATLLTAAFLYGLLIPDARDIFRMVVPG